MFADTDDSVLPAVHELLPENIVIAPTISTPRATRLGRLKSSVKFWFWRFRKILIILLGVVVVGIVASIISSYWLKPTIPATVVTNLSTNTIVPINTTNTPRAATNVPAVTNSTVDTDHDGLSDQEELLYNTNPKKKDTDEDGLSDREEVRVYATDPRNPDSDGDGYKDGEEVTHFYDPNSSDPKKRLFDLPK